MIYDFNDEVELSEVGGKAYNLYHLKSFGLNVPKWVCLPRKYFEQFLGKDYEKYVGLLENYKPGNEDKIVTLIESSEFNGDIRDELQRTIQECFDSRVRFAIRSSASDEDGEKYCFAGMLESYLDVENDIDEILKMVKKCYISAFSGRIMKYRAENGIINSKIGIAVIIQEMVDADYSGVMFTTNPITNNTDETVISVVEGIGENLVSGKNDSSDYIVDCLGEIVARDEKGLAKLDDATILRLSEIAKRIEGSYKPRRSVDIEYCIKDDKIYVLQCRLITNYAHIDKDKPRTILDNSNIIESYAGPTTDLTYSFAMEIYGKIYRQTLKNFYIKEEDIESIAYDLDHMLFFFENKIYYRLNGWYKMTALYPGYNKNKRYMETMMGVKTPLNETVAGKNTRLVKIYARFLNKMMRMKRLSADFIKRFDEVVGVYYNKSLDGYTNKELVMIYGGLERKILDDFVTPIANDMCTMVVFGKLTELLKKYKPDKYEKLLSRVLANESGVESVKQTTDLIDMVKKIKKQAEWLDLFQHNNSYVWRNVVKYPDLEVALRDYIYKYGPRTMDELKLETVTMQQDPDLLCDMIRNYLKMSELPTIESKIYSVSDEETLYEGLSGVVKLEIKELLKLSKYFIKNRESLRLRRTYIYSVVRNIFLSIGRNFEKEGLIDNYRDVFFLEKTEIFDFIEKNKRMDMRKLIKERKTRYGENARKEVYDRIYFYGDATSENALPIFAKTNNARDGILTGTAGGGGVVVGKVKYVTDPDNANVKDCILMAKRTDPGWTVLFPMAKAIIIEHGSMLSHSAVIAREMGMTLVVSVKNLTDKVPDGALVRVDGVNGTIEILGRNDVKE